MREVQVKVPDIGDFTDVSVIEVLVKPGDTVRAEQSLVTVESDKASMEIPSSHAGVVKEMKVKLGDTVSQGMLLAVHGASTFCRVTSVMVQEIAPPPGLRICRDNSVAEEPKSTDPGVMSSRTETGHPITSRQMPQHTTPCTHARARCLME